MLCGKKLIIHIFSSLILFTTISAPVQAKSVYVIIDRFSTIRAYNISSEEIEKQTDVKNLDDHGGAVGLVLDPDSATMFVTYEGSDIIEMVNAKAMVSLQKPTKVTEATNLAGIAFDQAKQKLYVVDRQTNKLFVYLWNPTVKTLTLEGGTYKTLGNLGGDGAYGIALDESNDRLYVSNATSAVHYYDTNNWNHINSVDVNRVAVGIALDPNRHYLYTGSWSGTEGDHPYLVRTDINDINNPTSDEYDVNNYVIGITADQDTGLVYVTTKNEDIEVYNTATFPSDPCFIETADIYQPRDLVIAGDVSYKPPLLKLEKTDDANGRAVIRGDYINYTINYSNPNDVNVTTVDIIDHLPDGIDTNDVTFSAGGDYNSTAGTVTWNDLKLTGVVVNINF